MGCRNRWLASTICSSFAHERLFLGPHKFSHFRVWYRDALSKYLQDVLLDTRTLSRPYWDRHRLEEIVDGHRKGIRNYTTAIHKVLTLELVHRLFIDESSRVPTAPSRCL